MRKHKTRWVKRPPDIEQRLNRAISAGMTQQEMAEALGVTRVTIRSWLADLGYECVTTYVKKKGSRPT